MQAGPFQSVRRFWISFQISAFFQSFDVRISELRSARCQLLTYPSGLRIREAHFFGFADDSAGGRRSGRLLIRANAPKSKWVMRTH